MRFGLDVGGTKLEIVALDATARECLRRRVPTPRGDYPATVHAIARLVHEAERALGVAGSVGVGIPGALSAATGRVKNANSTWLIDRPLKQDLEAALGREVRVANDANCFAVSEAADGAAAGCACVFGVILGTGVGGGIVVRGRLLEGANAIAGEWGHNPLPWPADDERPGPRCYCGRSGCLETWLSGPGFGRDAAHGQGGGAAVDARRHPGEPDFGVPRDANAVIAAMRRGEGDAGAAFGRYVDRLARGLATVINLLDPDVVVLGGGMSNVDELYDAVPARWSRYVFSDVVRTRLVRNRHGDSSGVRGAAWLWP